MDITAFTFEPSSSPSPQVRTSYVNDPLRDDGEIVADSLEFEVDGALTNSVEIWASRQSAFPRSDVTINVKAKPNSFVGVMVCEVA